MRAVCPVLPYSSSLFLLPPPPPLLQSDMTPLHAAAANGHAPVVALLLATPGVDPLHKNKVRGAQKPACLHTCLPAFPTPLPSDAGWLDSSGLGREL